MWLNSMQNPIRNLSRPNAKIKCLNVVCVFSVSLSNSYFFRMFYVCVYQLYGFLHSIWRMLAKSLAQSLYVYVSQYFHQLFHQKLIASGSNFVWQFSFINNFTIQSFSTKQMNTDSHKKKVHTRKLVHHWRKKKKRNKKTTIKHQYRNTHRNLCSKNCFSSSTEKVGTRLGCSARSLRSFCV